jgi:benzylsuccinate CoA-transferase BbsE subunit
MTDLDAPLRGITVLEVAGELTGYAGKLLADLGADVVLVAPPVAGGDFDATDFFFHHGKTRVPVSAERGGLGDLIADADVILQSAGRDEPSPAELEPDAVRAVNPRAVHVVLTPYGSTGPRADAPSTDLTRLAAGGLLYLGGYPDTEPVAAFGCQSTIATGIYGAVAALLALLDRERTGDGDTIDVSSQEVMTQALETSLAEYELLGRVRRRVGDAPREAGTGIFPCADGHVSIVAGRLGTATAWQNLVAWLQEAGVPGATALAGPGWDTLDHRQRPESIAEFSEIFCRFAAARTKDELYREGQRRSIAMAPVNDVADVLADPQLAARDFFVETTDPESGVTVRMPRPPFRLSATPEPLAEPA